MRRRPPAPRNDEAVPDLCGIRLPTMRGPGAVGVRAPARGASYTGWWRATLSPRTSRRSRQARRLRWRSAPPPCGPTPGAGATSACWRDAGRHGRDHPSRV